MESRNSNIQPKHTFFQNLTLTNILRKRKAPIVLDGCPEGHVDFKLPWRAAHFLNALPPRRLPYGVSYL